MKLHLLLGLLFLSSFITYSQNTLKGIVSNAHTKEPLAFVNIIINNNPQKGVITDIDGKFSIDTYEAIHTLEFHYLGFKTKSISNINKNFINISLEPSADELEEVVISSNNLAKAIINKVIAHRRLNHPKYIKQYTHDSYNKNVFDVISEKKESDSVLKNVFKGGHVLVMESVTQKKHIAPRLTQEIIIGNKVSGFKNPMFTSLATDMQPFTFYDENIKLLDMNFLNPISGGALSKYDYYLKETIFQKNDTIHIITFQPKSGKNFEALEGVLYINTNKYAIQNVIASPADPMKISLKIQQQYQFLENSTWFPEQLNYEMKLITGDEDEKQTVFANGKSYISNVNLQPNLSEKDFSVLSVKIEDDANQKDSLFWNRKRVELLSNKETTTYHVMDSLGIEYRFDKITSYFEKLPQGKLPIGKFDIDLTKTFIYNQHEGFRLGSGVYTNDGLVKNFSVGGYFGYGLKDHIWKYGVDATYHISKENEFYIKAGYQDDIKEIGSYGFATSDKLFDDFRNFIISKVDHIQGYNFTLGYRAFKYLKVKLEFNKDKITPLEDYNFEIPNYNFASYHNTSATIDLRYAPQEKLVEAFHQHVSLGTNYPIFSLRYTRGLKGFLQGNLDYNKFEAKIDQHIFLKNLGTTSYRVQAGFINDIIPKGQLFTGEGSYDEDFPYVMNNTFQTLRPYEFLSDTYIDFFFTHNFGSLLLKEKNFNPEIIIHHNLGWGTLDKNYDLYNFKSKEDLFLEAGIEIGRLLKFNYLDIGYLTLGAGAFYRYGSYNLDNFKDNIAFKFNTGFSFY